MDMTTNKTCCITMEREVNECLWYYIMRQNPNEWNEDVFGLSTEFENSVFSVRPFNWEIDSDGKSLNTWNFWHKESGLRISWYKYPLRSPFSNMYVSSHQLFMILQDCMNSIHPNSQVMIHKWWKWRS